MCLFDEEGQGFKSRWEHKIICLFLTLAIQTLIKNQSKIQENAKKDEKRTNHKKSLSTHRELNPGPSSSNKHIQHRNHFHLRNHLHWTCVAGRQGRYGERRALPHQGRRRRWWQTYPTAPQMRFEFLASDCCRPSNTADKVNDVENDLTLGHVFNS